MHQTQECELEKFWGATGEEGVVDVYTAETWVARKLHGRGPPVYRIPIEMVRTSRDSRRRAQKLIKVEEMYVDGVVLIVYFGKVDLTINK